MHSLTQEQADFISNLLKTIGGDEELTEQFANALDKSTEEFDKLADEIFTNLK